MNDHVSAWLSAQVKTYAEEEQELYAKYADFMSEILRKACSIVAPAASVEARAKSVPSFAEKAIRKRLKYGDPVHQLTDLCGVRVITDTQEEVERISQFIRKNFEIDEANSDDKGVLLGASQFGYRSVHLVVQLPKTLPGFVVPQKEGLIRKAEIQVRTALENAWARLAHDRIYKSPFTVPDTVQREMNRTAALLEEADRDFTLILDGLERYSTGQTALLQVSRAEDEIQTLRMISKSVKGRDESRRLALRIASIAKSLSRWQDVISVLEPFVGDKDAEVLRESGAASCRLSQKDINSEEFRSGTSRLQQALELDPEDAEAHAYLAWSLEIKDEQDARDHYARAYQLKPHNPYYLMAYLEFQIAVERQFGGLSLLGPTLEAAVETCRKHASAGIEIPKAHFTEAKLMLLLNQPYAALAACARGVCIATVPGSSVSTDTIQRELQSIKRLAPVKAAIQGHRWLERLLVLAMAAESGEGSSPEIVRLASTKLNFTQPIVMVAGGSELDQVPLQQAEYLQLALDGLAGTVVCGAVRAGTSEVVGSMVEKGIGFRTIGYHPQSLPAGTQLDKRHSSRVQTEGKDFSPEEPLQMWTDLLASGNRPKEIRLLGLGGGALAALEYQIALSLGGEVGVVADSGGTADDLRKDPCWNSVGNLRVLPSDRMSIKVFVAPMEKLKVEWLDEAARVAHEKYLQDNKHKIIDPAMVDWDELGDDLKESNRYHVSFSTEVLRSGGFGVRKAQGTGLTSASLDKKEIELMAEMEHGRWNVERLRGGWKIGPRDPANKRSPYLVPWSELTEEVRQWDRDSVIAFPEVLKKAGLEIYRLPR
jgi:ppGpp synthetase/RelA/SpoT-type nucleotidyltranferase